MKLIELFEDVPAGEKEQYNNLDTILNDIERDCSDIIKVYKQTNKLLYRGIRSALPYFKGRPRNNRRPLHSEIYKHNFINKGLAVLGFSTNRSNSIAVTSSLYDTQKYGNRYIIFPKNGFDFLYGNKKDLITMVHSDEDLYPWLEKHYSKAFLIKLLKKFSKKILFSYISKNILENEKTMKIYWEYIANKYNLLDINIAYAIQQGYEIMISGTEYYAVKENYISEIIQHFDFNMDDSI